MRKLGQESWDLKGRKPEETKKWLMVSAEETRAEDPDGLPS